VRFERFIEGSSVSRVFCQPCIVVFMHTWGYNYAYLCLINIDILSTLNYIEKRRQRGHNVVMLELPLKPKSPKLNGRLNCPHIYPPSRVYNKKLFYYTDKYFMETFGDSLTRSE
jgi:hypothetical protein